MPEYAHENRLQQLKSKEIGIMEDFLEAKQSKMKELSDAELSRTGQGSQANLKSKDAKKDAKAAPKKGAVADDKNAPQAVTVEYPEDKATVDSQYVIVERQFDAGRDEPVSDKLPDTELLGKNLGSFGEKHGDKGKELVKKYDILKSSKYAIAVKFRLNKDEEVEEVEESVQEEAVTQTDAKKKK